MILIKLLNNSGGFMKFLNLNFWRNKKRLFLGFLFFLLAFSVYSYHSMALSKDYYEISSRVSQLENEDSLGEGYSNVGWIKVQGTNLDYPIVTSINDSLSYPVEKDRYAWMNNHDDLYDEVVTVASHNIFNLGENLKRKSKDFRHFEELLSFAYYDFAVNNLYVQYTHNGKDYLYKIFAVDFLEEDDMEPFFTTYGKYKKTAVKKQIQLYKDKSLYHYSLDVNENDKILSLVTCSRIYGVYNKKYFFVHARLVRKNERINHYKVTRNEKVYDEFEKVMKGDE